MTEFRRGDVVLVAFTDETGEKRRPALVLSSGRYNSSRREAIIAPITSQTENAAFGDHIIGDWQAAGLLFPSVATGILSTVKEEAIVKKLGTISFPDLQAIQNNIHDALQLGMTIA